MRRSLVFVLLGLALATAACRNRQPVDPTSVSPGVNPSESPTVESISPTSSAEAYGPSDGSGGSDDGAGSASNTSSRCTKAEGGEVQVVAKGLSFDTDCITVAARATTTVELRNQDSAAHTFSVYDGNDEVLKGAATEGGEDRTYRLTNLDPGTYRFQCDIHPSMNGTLRVG